MPLMMRVFELFDVARAAGKVQAAGYRTWLEGTVRTLQTHPGAYLRTVPAGGDETGLLEGA